MSTANPYTEHGKVYRYANVHEWLGEAWLEAETVTDEEIWMLLSRMDADTIQNALQSAMESDGYFDDGVLCPECGGFMPVDHE